MNRSTSPGKRYLSPRHRDELKASGLTEETILIAGFQTLSDGVAINSLLCRKDATTFGESLIISYFEAGGQQVPHAEYVRVKPGKPPRVKDKMAKYLSPSRKPIRLYFPPNFAELLNRVKDDPSLPIIITEGEKKTLAVSQLGLPCVGLAGVDCWSEKRSTGDDGRKTGERILLSPLRELVTLGRSFCLLFDSDVIRNPRVLLAEAALAQALEDAGAVVLSGRVPDPGDGSKHGIDDHLVSYSFEVRADRLRKLLTEARPWREACVRTEAGCYRMRNGETLRVAVTRDGEISYPLANFEARIVEELIYDDGKNQSFHMRIEGKTKSGRILRSLVVPASEFAGMNWVITGWGADAIICPGHGAKEHLRAAIQMMSNAARKTVYTHTGWAVFDQVPRYLHSGGAIGPDGNDPAITCQLPEGLANFRLPDPPDGEEEQQAISAVFDILDSGIDPDVILPGLAAVFRSVLRKCDFGIWQYGRTGSFKSELAGVLMSFFGAEFNRTTLPGNWASTANSLEATAFTLKDALFVIDDFVAEGSRTEQQKMFASAARLIRAQGNSAGRGRLTADADQRTTKSPRGMIMTTAEILPNGHSILARLVIVEMSKKSVPVQNGFSDVLGQCQENARKGIYASAMSGFLRYLARRRGDGEKEEMVAGQRSNFHLEGDHRRGSGNLAELEVGYAAFLDYAICAGAIDTGERIRRQEELRLCLRRLAERQRNETINADPVSRFLELLRVVLLTGRCYLEQPPFPSDSKKSRGERIGWADGSMILLSPEATLSAINAIASENDQPLNQSVRSLGKLLHEAGKLSRVDQRGGSIRHTVRHTEDGVSYQVWYLDRSVLGKDGGQDGQVDSTHRDPPM